LEAIGGALHLEMQVGRRGVAGRSAQAQVLAFLDDLPGAYRQGTGGEMQVDGTEIVIVKIAVAVEIVL
jgi:hypothetical protein